MKPGTGLAQAEAELLHAQIDPDDWNILCCIDAASVTGKTGATGEQRAIARRVVRNLSEPLIARYGKQIFWQIRFVMIKARLSLVEDSEVAP